MMILVCAGPLTGCVEAPRSEPMWTVISIRRRPRKSARIAVVRNISCARPSGLALVQARPSRTAGPALRGASRCCAAVPRAAVHARRSNPTLERSALRTKRLNAGATNFSAARTPNRRTRREAAALLLESGRSNIAKWTESKPVVRRGAVRRLTCGRGRNRSRIFDATILGSLREGTSFFASACLIALGGGLALIGNTERLLGVAEDFPLDTPVVIWEAKILLIPRLPSQRFPQVHVGQPAFRLLRRGNGLGPQRRKRACLRPGRKSRRDQHPRRQKLSSVPTVGVTSAGSAG